jgi:hypothetical protein
VRDVVKDVEGRGEVARGVGVSMAIVLGVLDNDSGFFMHSPDTDPGSVAANIYTQAAGSKACQKCTCVDHARGDSRILKIAVGLWTMVRPFVLSG